MHRNQVDQMKFAFVIFVFAAAAVNAQSPPPNRIADAKIIEIGWDSRFPVYVQQHAAEMEKLPFDGIVLNLTSNGLHDLSKRPDRQHAFAGRAFGAKALIPSEYAESAEALRQTKFTRFT